MPDSPLTEKLVYLAFKDKFVGNGIQPSITKSIRKRVRKRIEKFQNDTEIKALIQQYTLQRITEVAIVLLEEQVFGSDSKARARFPDVFKVLPSQDDQPTDSGLEIAEGSSASVQRIGVYSPEALMNIGASPKTRNEEEQQIKTNLPAYVPKIATNEVVALKGVKGDGPEITTEGLQNTPAVPRSSQQLHTQPKTAMQSIDYIRLPLWDQHRILVRVQQALERACFTFAQKHLGGVLQREGWDCAEAVELNRWPRVLLTYREECDLNNTSNFGKPLPDLLNSITQLRHDTVHRARLSSSRILQHLSNAVLLARLLHDDVCTESMSIVHQMTRDAIEQMMRSRQLLDYKMAEITKEFVAKRAELEHREATLLEAAMREYNEPMMSVSESLDRLSGNLGGSDEVHAGWEHAHDGALSSNESFTLRSTLQSKKEQESGVTVVERNEESVKGVEQLSVFPTLVPTVDDGFIKLTLTREMKSAGKSKDEDLSESQRRPAQMNLELGSRESHPNQSLKQSVSCHQNVLMTKEDVAEEDEEEIRTAKAVTSDWNDSDQQEYDEEIFSKTSTDPAPTGGVTIENDADPDGGRPPVEEVVPSKHMEEDGVAGVE
ncbi:hypothetical protein yc1106_09485 [Curvularia clavata]|uniref:Ubiquinol-cytochrome-c reductase cytochrome c1 n=1 Tax=Curvularia clavata TaxID=95742 RepID=A0A9Q8ZF53_CURCL|nr:hypothetical protein yc1106_09485 [Curvularia clavata]